MTKEEYASKLHLLQQEVEHLQRWKEEAKVLLNPIFEYAEKHPDMKIGGSMTEFVLNRCKEYDKLKKDIEGYELKEAFDALDYSNLSEKIVAYQVEYDKLKEHYNTVYDEHGKLVTALEKLKPEYAALKAKADKMADALIVCQQALNVKEGDGFTVAFNAYTKAFSLSNSALSSYNTNTNQNENK